MVSEKPKDWTSGPTGPNRRSPLQATHETLGARLEERGGWLVPQFYRSSQAEAEAVRERVGITDVSANGKLVVRGPDAGELLHNQFDTASATSGSIRWTDFEGAELGIAQLAPDEYFITAPPGAEGQIAARLEKARGTRFLTIVDQTAGLAGLLVAGPSSQRLLNKFSSLRFTGRGPADRLVAEGSLATIRALILRRQWRLPAFECFFERSYAAFLWEAVIDAGEEFGAIPCGWEAVVEASRSKSNS